MDIAAYQEGNTLSSPSELGCERWSTALVWFKSLYNLLQSFINCRSWSLAIHGRENVFISSQLVLGYFLGQHSIKARTVACSWHRKRFNVFGFDTGFHCSQHHSLRRKGYFSAMVSILSLIIYHLWCFTSCKRMVQQRDTHFILEIDLFQIQYLPNTSFPCCGFCMIGDKHLCPALGNVTI